MAVLKSSLILSLIDNVSGPARRIGGVMAGFQEQQIAAMASFNSVAATVATAAATYFAVHQGLDMTAGAAMRFESAFADVKKVVDATPEQFEFLSKTIRKMSTDLPIAATDIAELFAAAGESGIATNELKSFAEMAARVGIAFDMGAGEAGESLAKLKSQLGLTVGETGEMADAINHLSNNMASKAKDITAYMLKVGKFAEMGGFAKEQVAAIGSAMISAGAQADEAGTAMMNVVRKMTAGDFAKKDQREAAKALGLDLPTLAKQMKKDAPKALKTVLKALSKAPEEQQVALLSKFFGDEARAFAPLVGNLELLDEALDSVNDKAKYGGSAFREYVARADTLGNVIEILNNRFVEIGISLGDRMLPSIKEAALGIGDVIDSLGERGHIFAQMEAAFKGFAQGMGAEGGIRDMINDLGDLLFGAAEGGAAADKIGRIFVKFKEWGAAVRELSAAIAANPLAQFFAQLAPYGFQIMLWGVGIAMLAGTIRKLAAALMFLSGASTILAALKAVGGIAAIVGGGTAAGAGAAAAGAGAAGTAAAGGGLAAKALGLARGSIFGTAAAGLWTAGKEAYTGDTPYSQGKSIIPSPTDALHAVGSAISSINSKLSAVPQQSGVYAAMALDSANRDRSMGFGGSTDNLPGKTKDDIDIGVLRAAMAPQGVQQVMVTNPAPPQINQSNVFNITTSDPQAAASSAAGQLGESVKSAVESGYMDSR